MAIIKRHKYLLVLTFIFFTSIFVGCEKDNVIDDEDVGTTALVKDVIIPKQMSIAKGSSQAISGKGFESKDLLVFSTESTDIEIPLEKIENTYVTFIVPNELNDGDYTISVKRNTRTQELGKTFVRIVLDISVPNKDGHSIKGAVFCGTKPLKGVRVSDGFTTTLTDENGFYWLQSEKKHGYVFISSPSGYQPKTTNNVVPGFWASLSAPTNVVEQHNFELVEVDDTKHTLIVATDLHLANRGASSNNDMNQFNSGFMNETKTFVENLNNTAVYTIVLGDMSWDGYWYDKKYDIASYKSTMSSYPTPMYHVMGNHDNDPYYADDFLAEMRYKKEFGPTYFSMDMGQIHYIFLDNTVYTNNGGKIGTIGDREYLKYLTLEQANWLKDDLSAIKDKTKPIVVSFHCPSTGNYNANFTTSLSFNPSSKAVEFHNMFNGFTKVHFLSGHTHYNTHTTIGNNIEEHNIAAVCATWWWGGKLTGINLSRDGSPAGYAVFDIDGTDIKWYYKSVGQDKNKQFRTYDINSVKTYFAQSSVKSIMDKLPGNRSKDYDTLKENDVLINVWNYDSKWIIEVEENGVIKTPVRVYLRDPLHAITYDYPRMRDNGDVTEGFLTGPNPHMFKVSTNSASSSLKIKVTDRFGNVYQETMTRPKQFKLSFE